MRFSTASRAVRIRTGDQMPASRSSRQVVEAVLAGKHHVEHDRVVGHGPRHPERVLAAACEIGGVPFLAQPAGEQRRQLLLVFDYEHAHEANCARADERTMRMLSFPPNLRC